jgi:hypothetical protein
VAWASVRECPLRAKAVVPGLRLTKIRLMRGAAAITALVLAVGALAGTTHSARFSKAAGVQVNCHQIRLAFVFWPKGHGAIRSVRLPALRTPHIQIFKNGDQYRPRPDLGLATAHGFISFSNKCNGISGAPPSGRVAHAKTAYAQLALSCGIPLRIVKLHLHHAVGGLLLDVGNKGARVVSARVLTKGSTLTYDSHLCHPGPAPR